MSISCRFWRMEMILNFFTLSISSQWTRYTLQIVCPHLKSLLSLIGNDCVDYLTLIEWTFFCLIRQVTVFPDGDLHVKAVPSFNRGKGSWPSRHSSPGSTKSQQTTHAEVTHQGRRSPTPANKSKIRPKTPVQASSNHQEVPVTPVTPRYVRSRTPIKGRAYGKFDYTRKLDGTREQPVAARVQSGDRNVLVKGAGYTSPRPASWFCAPVTLSEFGLLAVSGSRVGMFSFLISKILWVAKLRGKTTGPGVPIKEFRKHLEYLAHSGMLEPNRKRSSAIVKE